MNAIARTVSLSLAALALSASVASAQTTPQRPAPAVKAASSGVKQPGPLGPITLPPIDLPKEGGLQSWPGAVITSFVGMPALEGGGGARNLGVLPQRTVLVKAGVYDR